ncbi:stability/partitioning determinant [Paracoccus sp. S-4012]|uniref:stability/partitioning determinant n=1 Tax=Paracoccus sp. S-4012 TaxID=2665648 RepID=UPI0012B15C0D|nr:stability/partitioning determinant [Paracoccus sp. S-4012]MRX52060.1 stability/partitioning determinant [Paracoccus sp. S-4012]
MAKERADLGFSDALEEFDPAEWQPKLDKPARSKPEQAASRMIAEASGFRSREARVPERAGEGGSAPRRRRTGRNTQFNLKARPETIAAFCAVADGQGWGLGETLEHAVALLEREYGPKA